MTLNIEIPSEQEAALQAKAQAEGLTAEQYARRVLERDLEIVSRPRRVSEVIREIWSDAPPEVRAKMPKDGASQVDHYVYGLPKCDH